MTPIQIVLALAAISFVILVIYIIKLTKRVQQTLKVVDEAVNSGRAGMDKILEQIEPVISNLSQLEETTRELLAGMDGRISRLEGEVVPLLQDLRETAKAYQRLEEGLEKRIEQDVPPLLEDVHNITGDIKELTGDIKDKVEQSKALFDAVKETGETMRVVTGIVRSGLSGLAVQLASMAVGARASLEFLADNLTTKGGGKR